MNLIYNRDFWTFYKLNRESMDKIIHAQFASLHVDRESAAGMFSDVILYMYRAKIPQGFDPSSSQLNTYITSTARGLVKKVLTDENKQRCPTVVYNEGEEEEVTVRRGRVPVWGLNALPDDMEEGGSFQLSIDDHEEFETKDLINKIKRILSPKERRILDFALYGMTYDQIGACLKVSGRFIGIIRVRDIREKVQSFLQKEHILVKVKKALPEEQVLVDA